MEAAVGMAGFAGIVAAIRSRDTALWAPVHRLLLQMLLLASAVATSFALLPAVLAEARIPEPTIWRVGSAALLVWQVLIALHRTRQLRETPNPIPRGLYLWVTGIVLLQAYNLVLGASWPYLVGIFGILVNAFIFFLTLLLGRSEAENDVD